MKKLLCIFIALVIVLSFSGCGGTPTKNSYGVSYDGIKYSEESLAEAPAAMPEEGKSYSAFNEDYSYSADITDNKVLS